MNRKSLPKYAATFCGIAAVILSLLFLSSIETTISTTTTATYAMLQTITKISNKISHIFSFIEINYIELLISIAAILHIIVEVTDNKKYKKFLVTSYIALFLISFTSSIEFLSIVT